MTGRRWLQAVTGRYYERYLFFAAIGPDSGVPMTGRQPVEAHAIRAAGRTPLRVGFVLLHRFTLLPFAGFIDVLRLASDEGDRSRQRLCKWSVMSEDCRPVQASCGTAVQPDSTFKDPAEFDYIVVVGGLLDEEHRQSDSTLNAYLFEAASKEVPIAALCTGVFVLVRLGLMSGKRCCISWYHYRDFRRMFPDVTPVTSSLYVVDGNRISCAGGTGAIDLAAWLVKRHISKAAADKALHILLTDRVRPADSPQPQIVPQYCTRDKRLAKATDFIDENLSLPLHVDSIAGRAGVSRRQLERMFRNEFGMSPSEFARHRRLQQAHWLLLKTGRPITDIAQDCGFADGSHLARHFRSTFGISPQGIREAAMACDHRASLRQSPGTAGNGQQ